MPLSEDHEVRAKAVEFALNLNGTRREPAAAKRVVADAAAFEEYLTSGTQVGTDTAEPTAKAKKHERE